VRGNMCEGHGVPGESLGVREIATQSASSTIGGQKAGRPRVAIVLFNLGGPDRPEAIGPFLLNLFRDPAILRVPFFVRPLLARFLANRRLAPATANYALLGGKSPLLELTQSQAAAIETALPDLDARCFIAMRYWHPFSEETARAVKSWHPEEVVLLPLYPQYSTTTTGSSLTAWRNAAAKVGLAAPVAAICCYPEHPAFIAATAARIAAEYDNAAARLPFGVGLRVLFSAHGLPEIIVRRGDPYQWQIEGTAAALAEALGRPGLDWVVCYQSRATPQKWLEPSTEQEIERAARDGVAVLVIPIAFVSEHSETLVELDVEYRALADRLGMPGYFRVPAQNAAAAFIAVLADLIRQARAAGPGACSAAPQRICPAKFTACPLMPPPPITSGN
jgi:protoporphyrin/coproporphyrin ferrochelatase